MYNWEIVEAMFKEYPLVKQHIDSYNEFVNHKIHKIIEELNYETNKPGDKTEIKFHKIRLEKPIVTEADGSKRDLTPTEARLRNRIYSAPVFVDISMIEEGIERDRDEIYIGELPIMVKSDLCRLKGMTKEELIMMGEDPEEQGGYFIINGSERALVSVEDLAPNKMIVSKVKKGGNDLVVGNIFSLKGGFRAKIEIQRKKDREAYISFPASPKNLNIFVVLKALGFDTKPKLLKAFTERSEIENDILINLEGLEIKNEDEALDYLGKRVAAGQTEEYRKNRAGYILDNYLLPHIGLKPEDRKKKGYFLIRMIERCIEVANGKREEDDKDHYANKRVKISGKLMEELFRYAIGYFIKDIKYQIERAHTRGRKMQIRTLVRPDAMSDRIRFHMSTGTWTNGRTGISQLLDRMTYMSTMSHLRRVISPLQRTQPHFEARDLHPTHLGKICPNETPEGQSVGLVKNMAISAFISARETEGLEKEFEDIGLQLIKK